MQNFAVFRCDASQEMGAGHLVRCYVLAQYLVQRNWQCAFICSPGSHQFFPKSNLDAVDYQEIEDEQKDLHALYPDGCKVLIIDHYQRDKNYQRQYRDWAEYIVVIDDLANREHDCDLLIDAAFGGKKESYLGLVPKHCTLLLGSEYALLRPQFWHYRQYHKQIPSKQHLFVHFGALDQHNLLPQIITILNQLSLPFEFVIDVLVSSKTANFQQIKEAAKASILPVIVHSDTQDVAPILSQASIALAAAGGNSWERCCLGIPTIFIETALNQRVTLRSIVQAGAGIDIGTANPLQVNRLKKALLDLWQDREKRQLFSAAARSLCDGLGVRRVYIAIQQMIQNRQSNVGIRLTQKSDVKMLYQWQCIAGIRKYSHHPTMPSYQQHCQWFASKIHDVNCLFHIIQYQQQDVGMIRLDKLTQLTDKSYLVSILVVPALQGQGIATKALALVRQLLPEMHLYAQIQAENKASIRLFTQSGYVQQGHYYVSLGS